MAGLPDVQTGLPMPKVRTPKESIKVLLEKAEAEIKVLSDALQESRANDAAAMGWLAECRFASGDNGKRMLPEFVEYLRELKIGHDRYEKLRKLNVSQFRDLYIRNIKGEGQFDDLVDGL